MRQDLNLARRLAVVAFTDLLCWLPIGILGFLALDGQVLGGEAYAWMAVFEVSVNSALNPTLSSLPVIRNYLVKVITKCIALKKMKVGSSSEDHMAMSRI
ncbi:hypothetical protein RRG08_041442 [Elysia crispata]|uniref:Uncharacterized protein n=1 Tax=Elysia crispata TaxID=231223 RepID=A0AAE1CNT1_9GAST|nr:hypothetical protein RRG08_041442 [Elysia crispata]